MTLPLPYRPAAVNEVIQEELRSSLKLTLNLKQLFMAAMITWHNKLSPKELSLLTKRKLIKRSVLEAHRLNLPYERIPPDWMSIMVRERGLVCYISRRALSRREFRQATSLIPDLPTPPDDGSNKFIDLTDDPPPESWTKAKEEGNPLPRYLSIASADIGNILYWSYDTDKWEMDKKYAFTGEPAPE